MTDTSTQQNEPDGAAAEKPSRWSAAGVLAVVFLAIVFSQTVLRREPPQEDAPPAEPVGAVTLAIDPGEGQANERTLDLLPGMTALEALESAPEDWRGPVDRTNSGINAFVEAIGGVENEGPGGRNWQYYVNGERAAVGAGARRLADGDRVLWKFAPQE